MNTMIAIFEVKRYMERERLNKANIIAERITNLKNIADLFLGYEKIIVTNRIEFSNVYFPSLYDKDGESYEFIRNLIVTAVKAKIEESEKELKAL